MTATKLVTMDGNEAAASVAFRMNEVIAIYPITPASPMGELSDQWASYRQRNLWGDIPKVIEMQSEGGAAGAVHGSLQGGALTTTFTASQGLLLMLPNLYKIAGELTATCIHIAARSVATHALSIFGDHTDVMACRQAGLGLLASGSPQEAHDLGAIGTVASLESRIPFLHFFDGFRTSHEVAKMAYIPDDVLRAFVPEERIREHRRRALTPDRPVLRGTAQNPDAFMQAREACNSFYDACPDAVEKTMAHFAELTGRRYGLFDYVGHPEAERVVVLMGSGAETAHETVEHLAAQGERVGAIKVRLYRPFSMKHFVKALPPTTRGIAVLDRTKEPGAPGEPLYLDTIAALHEEWEGDMPKVTGGRYGLSSKEFTPAMIKGVLDELGKDAPKRHFTVGIIDDVTHTSLEWDRELDIEPDSVVRAVFFGLGSDGTVGANKNSIKIIGEETPNHAQGYFVYDSKKAGAVTVSHLRFGPDPIRSTYLVSHASFVAVHHFDFLEQRDVLAVAKPGAVFLLNAPYGPDEVWDKLPLEVQQAVLEKKLKFHVIDAATVARDTGMGRRVNTVMQTCFFALSGVLERDEAILQIKRAIEKTYKDKGQEVVKRNYAAVDQTLEHLHEVKVPGKTTTDRKRPPVVPDEAPDFVARVSARMMAGEGDLLPVSAFPVDGTWPLGTSKWEKRNIALEIPVWDPSICIQCNKCTLVCPHAAIRAKVYPPDALADAPSAFLSMDYKAPDFKGMKYTIQVAPEDCSGCHVCVLICPAKDKSNPKHKSINMEPQRPLRDQERVSYDFFLGLPEADRTQVKLDVKRTQFFEPLFEYSGACAGCGETPYVKLLTQLFGDRTIIANATGCSSIYGANLPTTPFSTNKDGRGPAWSNSLFEDNAEFGLGIALAASELTKHARNLVKKLSGKLGDELARGLLETNQDDEIGIAAARSAVAALKEKLGGIESPEGKRLAEIADYLVRKTIWIVGGDGWAYDIGYGGLDHVLAVGHDVNILVLDTEVYSNTGGQQSKATPMAAAAKFAAAGKETQKKDLGLMAMAYGNVYVAQVAYGARDAQTLKAFLEAESYRGASMIIAYSHCIAHGYDLRWGPDQQTKAVKSGYWPLYRFDPRRAAEGKPAMQLDSGKPKGSLFDFVAAEARFKMVERQDPARFKTMLETSTRLAQEKFDLYERLATAPAADDTKGR